MEMRRIGLFLFALLALGHGAGCKKSQSDQSAQSEPPAAPILVIPKAETVARVHWLGRKRLAAETNAAHLLSIWNLPESGKLGEQTLDKLALAPWRLWKGDASTNGAPTALMRPLLDDLLQEESYLEVRHVTNQLGETVFAIRLDAGRAGLWQTNLATVMESLIGVKVTATENGWSLKRPDSPGLLELVRAGDWTLLGSVHEQTGLLGEALACIQRDRQSFQRQAFGLTAHANDQRIPPVADVVSPRKSRCAQQSVIRYRH